MAAKLLVYTAVVGLLIFIVSAELGREHWEQSKLKCHCCCLVAKSCLTLCDSMDCSMSGSSVLHYPSVAQIHVKSVMFSNSFFLCHPLLLLPSLFLIIRVFSNELALCIKWLDKMPHRSPIQPFFLNKNCPGCCKPLVNFQNSGVEF